MAPSLFQANGPNRAILLPVRVMHYGKQLILLSLIESARGCCNFRRFLPWEHYIVVIILGTVDIIIVCIVLGEFLSALKFLHPTSLITTVDRGAVFWDRRHEVWEDSVVVIAEGLNQALVRFPFSLHWISTMLRCLWKLYLFHLSVYLTSLWVRVLVLNNISDYLGSVES